MTKGENIKDKITKWERNIGISDRGRNMTKEGD
jgi:hypothetical protein